MSIQFPSDLEVSWCLTVDCEFSSTERHEDSHFPPGVSATTAEPAAGRTAWAGRSTCRRVLLSPAGPMGCVFTCGPSSNSTWKSAWSPSRKPTPTRESVPARNTELRPSAVALAGTQCYWTGVKSGKLADREWFLLDMLFVSLGIGIYVLNVHTNWLLQMQWHFYR
jgi:hypothetical protein